VLFLRQAWTVAAKDLRSELRTKEAVTASLAFSLAILVLFSFAFDPGNSEVNILAVSGGLLWLVFSFAGALSLNRSFARELQNDCLDALIASPAPTGALFVGKALANYALLMAVEIISLGIFSVFYDVKVMMYFWPLLLTMLLTTWAITIIGTLFSALTVNLRMREVMLPILTYPLLIPPLMSAITLTTDLLGGVPLGQDMLWVKVLLAFDIAFSGLAVVLIDIVLVG
jgi:heme exporter protein B